MPNILESSEANSGRECPRAQLRFCKPIQNRMGKVKNFIQSRLNRAEADLAVRENRVEL